jgi:hypothetical protein
LRFSFNPETVNALIRLLKNARAILMVLAGPRAVNCAGLAVVVFGWLILTKLSFADNSTPSADEQYAVFVEVDGEMPHFAKYFRLIGRQYNSDMAAYVFTCQSVESDKSEWFVYLPIELAYNLDAVRALFEQAEVDHAFWKAKLGGKPSHH